MTDDDYGKLLDGGWVVASPEDVDEWRREIRAKCRADRQKVRTGVTNAGGAYALLLDRMNRDHDLYVAYDEAETDEERAEVVRTMEAYGLQTPEEAQRRLSDYLGDYLGE